MASKKELRYWDSYNILSLACPCGFVRGIKTIKTLY